MPLTNEQIATMRWMIDYCEFLAISSSEQASYDYANDVAGWHADDPQCARLWSGRQQEQLHDMELAQQDYETNGIRYALPWAGEREAE